MIDLLWLLKWTGLFIISLFWIHMAAQLWTNGSLTSIDRYYQTKQKQEVQEDGKET